MTAMENSRAGNRKNTHQQQPNNKTHRPIHFFVTPARTPVRAPNRAPITITIRLIVHRPAITTTTTTHTLALHRQTNAPEMVRQMHEIIFAMHCKSERSRIQLEWIKNQYQLKTLQRPNNNRSQMVGRMLTFANRIVHCPSIALQCSKFATIQLNSCHR